MNDRHRIDLEQNKPERLELLRAQRLFYARAKLRQNVFTVMALMLPAAGVLFGATFPKIRPFLGFGSILILLLEVGLISRLQREDCKRGAKVQEQFDTEVLQLDWNHLVAGSRVDAEEVRDIASGPMPDAEKMRLESWYEPVVSKLPLALGRLVCQRTNVAYDMRVRKAYSRILLWAFITLVVGLTLPVLYQGLTVDELILTMYLPALPLAAFMLRERLKQVDTVESLNTLKAEIEKAWDKALSGASDAELTTTARALQDAIYRHRASNPLVFDWLYNRFRKRNEDLVQHAADKFVVEAQQKLGLSKEAL